MILFDSKLLKSHLATLTFMANFAYLFILFYVLLLFPSHETALFICWVWVMQQSSFLWDQTELHERLWLMRIHQHNTFTVAVVSLCEDSAILTKSAVGFKNMSEALLWQQDNARYWGIIVRRVSFKWHLEVFGW